MKRIFLRTDLSVPEARELDARQSTVASVAFLERNRQGAITPSCCDHPFFESNLFCNTSIIVNDKGRYHS